MNSMQAGLANQAETQGIRYSSDDFTRLDETDDSNFYEADRLVSHLDAVALGTVEELIRTLVQEESPAVLDLMASWNSHLPPSLKPCKVVGLGLNRRELKSNPALDQYVIHDLNRQPILPFADQSFDLVLNTVSVDYLTQPVEVFREVGRVLKPGGLHLVIFSNRWFEPKVTNIWRRSSEEERMILVEDWFQASGAFERPQTFLSKGKPRPADDKYAHLGIPSDPIYAVFADRLGGAPGRRPRPTPYQEAAPATEDRQFQLRAGQVAQTLRCPHCGQRLRKWEVPQTPFTEWDTPFMYICFNDACPYLVGGWDRMARQGNFGVSYRLMFNPQTGGLMPVPVYSLGMLKDGIID